ncbi:MAG: THUMP domain-containing protein [Thermosphaera sp.]
MITHEPGLDNYRFIIGSIRSRIQDYIVVDKGPCVILLRVPNPYESIEKLRDLPNEAPMVYRVIPIDVIVDPYVEDVAEKAGSLAMERIPPDKTYRVTLHGRLYWRETRMPAHSMDAVKIIAEKIDRPVSLSSPDYVVYIRSVKLYHRRRYAAVTVAPPEKIIVSKSDKP